MCAAKREETKTDKRKGRGGRVVRRTVGGFYLASGTVIAYLAGWQGINLFKLNEIPLEAQILGYVATLVAFGLAIVAMGASIFPAKQDARIDEILTELAAVRGKLDQVQRTINDRDIQS